MFVESSDENLVGIFILFRGGTTVLCETILLLLELPKGIVAQPPEDAGKHLGTLPIVDRFAEGVERGDQIFTLFICRFVPGGEDVISFENFCCVHEAILYWTTGFWNVTQVPFWTQSLEWNPPRNTALVWIFLNLFSIDQLTDRVYRFYPQKGGDQFLGRTAFG